MSNIFNQKNALIDSINTIRESVSKEYADEHKAKAMAARNSGKMSDYHKHMATHHDHLATHSTDKGDSRAADLHMNKATEHEAKAKEVSEAKLDSVKPHELKKDFKDRQDKDIDNDGKVDSSDEYLHKRRQAISQKMKSEGFSDKEIDALLEYEMSRRADGKYVDDEGNVMSKPPSRWASKKVTSDMYRSGNRSSYRPSYGKPKNEEVEVDEAFSDNDWVHINRSGSFHNPKKDTIIGYSKSHKDPNRAPKIKSGANTALRVSNAKKKGYEIKESVELGYKEEQIDELSKKTLGSYAKKATDQAKAASSLAGQYGHSRGTYVFSKEPLPDDSRKKIAAAARDVANKRSQGVKKAIDRLAKEEVELDELTATEKKHINAMYDKKGKLTDVGKKVFAQSAQNKNKFPHNTSASQGQRMGGKSTMYGEEVEIEESMNNTKHYGAKDIKGLKLKGAKLELLNKIIEKMGSINDYGLEKITQSSEPTVRKALSWFDRVNYKGRFTSQDFGHLMNVLGEEVEIEEAMGPLSPQQIAKLKKAYGSINRVNVTGPAYKKLKTWVKSMDKEDLMTLAKAKVKWLSGFAASELRLTHNIKMKPAEYTESVELEEAQLDELTAAEKKLVNTMYDKKGNLTDSGKQVRAHSQKKFPHNVSASQGERMGGKSTMYGEEVEIEEIEEAQLDELSRKTLASYTKSAADQMTVSARLGDYFGDRASKSRNKDKKSLRDRLAYNHYLKYRKREKGIEKATDRLAKEEVQEAYDIQEQSDREEKHEMAQTQAHFIKYAAEEIIEYIEMGGEIEEWYQNKLSKVHSDLESLHSYMEGEKRRLGMAEEVEIEESNEISPRQNMLLRAMATDPKDINKMRRAIKLGDKALMNPVMRQEILRMLDQMMDVSLNDPTIFAKTRQIFKKRKATDTTNTE